MYVIGSKDGCIKLWDGVLNWCIIIFEKVYDGVEVCFVIFFKNFKYIFLSGKDFVVKFWEILIGWILVRYMGVGLSGC